jgi:hypothetical protein
MLAGGRQEVNRLRENRDCGHLASPSTLRTFDEIRHRGFAALCITIAISASNGSFGSEST